MHPKGPPDSAASAAGGESKLDALESSSTTATYEVRRHRVPTKALLVQEAEFAKKKGHRSVKVGAHQRAPGPGGRRAGRGSRRGLAAVRHGGVLLRVLSRITRDGDSQENDTTA